MDSTVVAGIIGGLATVVAALISVGVTLHVSRKRSYSPKVIANFSHAQRDYTKTQGRLEQLLKGIISTEKKPDLYITNFGTPVEILQKCKGFSDYHSYLVELTRSSKCVVHRYYVLTGELALDQHIRHIQERSKGVTDANMYCCDSTALATLGDTIVNFLALSGTFGAVTFESKSKVLLSMHTTEPSEVAALIEVIRGIEPHCSRILSNGQITGGA